MEDTKAFVFKVDFDGDLRRFVLADLSYMSLEVKTREVFCFSEEDEIRFLHRDIEGDMITIATEANLLEVYAAIATSPKIIRLYLDVDRIVIGAQKPEVLDEPQKLFAEHEKLGRTPEPQDESAEPEGTTSARTSSSASSTPQGRPTCFERKQRALSRLASRRRRLMQRHQNLIEKCDRLEERATVVAERLNNVDRRILDTLNACPELAAFFPELDLEGVVAGPESDRSRSNLFCDSCDIGILAYSEVHFHCEACGNFDLCVRCERQFGHEHALVRIEPGTRRLPSFFDLSFDDEVRTLEACCLDVWHELEASGLMCPRNLAILAIISLLSFVMALTTAYALCSAIFSVATP